MNILFVTDLIPIKESENCAKALVPIVKELSLNANVDIVRPNFLLNSLIRGKKILKNGQYSCCGLEIKNINFYLPFLTEIKTIDVDKYDKIIAHMPSGILFVERLLKFCEKRPIVVYAVHQSDIHLMTSLKYAIYFRNAMKKAYKNCDKILCRAPHLKQKLLKILPDALVKTEVKSSKIEKSFFVSEEEMFAKIKAHECIKFLTAANLIKRKNVDIAIKAFAQFKGYDFTFEIIGEGKELYKLKRVVKKLKMDDKISFLGRLSNEETLKKMREANVFILPSINETLGLAYLEASASGCLCIGTKNTGIDGLFQDNINCFLTEPSVNSLVKVLNKVFKLTEEDFKNLLSNRKIVEF